MRRITVRILTGVIVCGALVLVVYGPLTKTRASIRQEGSVEPVAMEPRAKVDSVTLASPGRIEGESDSIEVGAATDGVIGKIHVREGQRVSKGEVLAELDCRDLQSALPV